MFATVAGCYTSSASVLITVYSKLKVSILFYVLQ